MQQAEPHSKAGGTRREWLVPLVAWAGAAVWAEFAGFDMRIPWDAFQLLDPAWLAARPFRSLWLLHSQPPVLNALAAAALALSSLLHVSPEAVAKALFLGLSLAGCCLLYDIGRRLTGRPAFAGALVVALVASPGYPVFANTFSYTFPLLPLLLLVAWTAVRASERLTGARLSAFACATAAVTLTRTLYSPLWAVLTFALGIGVAMRAQAVSWRRTLRVGAVPAALLIVGLAAWPLKNALVFGRATYSSWVGWNLARNLPVGGAHELNRYLEHGAVPADLRERAAARIPCAVVLDDPIAASTAKSNGARNWNHYIFLMTGPHMAREAMRWRFAHPFEWLGMTFGQYTMWSRPTFVHSYSGNGMGTAHPAHAAWSRFVGAVVFADLRPVLEPLPGLVEWRSYARLGPLTMPYTAYGFVLVPAISIAGLVCAARGMRRRRLDGAGLAVPLLSFLWTLAAPCLTDGAEGNRMRFAVGFVPLTIVAVCAATLARRDQATSTPSEADAPTIAAP